IGLSYYAVTKILAVTSRKFFIQSTVHEAFGQDRFMFFPDIMICTTDAVIEKRQELWGSLIDKITYVEYNKTQGWERSPCAEWQDKLTILSMRNVPIDTTDYWSTSISIRPKNTSMLADFFGTRAGVYITSSQNNLYAENGGLWPLDTPLPRDYNSNYQLITQGDTSLSISVDSKTKNVIRKDFLGLFGSFEDNLKHEVAIFGSTFTNPTSNISVLDVFMNRYFLEETEIP
ncbi:hypothetical protein BGZ65_010325, partial [Modicella reniformis]